MALDRPTIPGGSAWTLTTSACSFLLLFALAFLAFSTLPAQAAPEDEVVPAAPAPEDPKPEEPKDDDGGKEEPLGTEYAWRPAGQAGLSGRGLSCLRIHPKNDSVLWAHVHGMGPARSEDGGKTWTQMLNGVPEKMHPGLRSSVRISLDPQKVKTLYLVIDGQIFRSDDGGDNWESISSGALASLSWDKLTNRHLSWQVEVDPQKSVHLLVGTRNDGNHNGGLFESTNSGKAWEKISGTGIPKSGLGNDAFMIRQDPKSDKYIVIAGRTGLWRSDDRGRNFERNDPGGEGIHDYRDMSYFPAGSKDLYLADARGIWRSKDGGKKWDKKPLHEGDALAVVVDPYNKKRVYAIFHDSGLAVSEDTRHKDWSALGGRYAGAAAAKDPDQPEKDDGDAPAPDVGGYRAAEIREIVVHPRDRKTVYLASPVTGLHVSSDDGMTFAEVLPPEDADEKTVIPARIPGISQVGVHPVYGGDHLAVSDEGVVYASADRGATWTRRGRLGMAPGLLEPDPATPHAWWAAGRRLLRSEDDGATWTAVGPVGTDPKADAEDRIVALHVGAPTGEGEDRKAGALAILLERSGVVMTSTDAGATWNSTKPPFKRAKGAGAQTWAAALAVDPDNAEHLVVAARTTREAPSLSDENGGVFETWDGGKKWDDITEDLKPGKKDNVAAQKLKRNWNHAALVAIDNHSGLLIYGASGRGLFAREIVDPKGKKPEQPPAWVDISPKAPERPEILVTCFTSTADGEDSRLVVQLAGAGDVTGCYSITGAGLKALRDLRAGVADAPEDAAWAVLPSPGERVKLTSLAADGQLPGRLVGSEGEGESGVVIYELPGSKPVDPAEVKRKAEEAARAAAAAVRKPPEGMRAFTAGEDKAVFIWGVDTGAAIQKIPGHEGAIHCVVLSPDEQYLITAGAEKAIRLLKPANGDVIATIPAEAVVVALVVDADSKYLYAALAEKNQILQIDLATKVMKTFSGPTAAISALAVSEDVGRMYSAGHDNKIRFWDTNAGSQVNEIDFGSPVAQLAVDADGTRFYAAGVDGSLRVYDPTGKELVKLEAKELGPVNDMCLSPDGAQLHLAMANGVRALKADTLEQATFHEAAGHKLLSVTTSADGIWVLAGDDQGNLWLWFRGEAKARWFKKKHDGKIRSVTVTPDETEDPDDAPPPAPGDGKPGDAKPGDAKPGDAEPGDAKPGDAKPGEEKTEPPKADDGAKPGDEKPGETKPDDPKK